MPMGMMALAVCLAFVPLPRTDTGGAFRDAPRDAESCTPGNPVPRPLEGTLLLGPYLLPDGPGAVRVRWEVMGRREGAVVVKGEEDSRIVGVALPVEKLTADLPGRMYEARITGSLLKPCAKCSFRLEPFEGEGFPHTFRAPPDAGSICPDMRVVVYGDSRTNHKIHGSLVPALRKAAPDLLLNNGDIVHSAPRVYEWHRFFRIEKDVLATAPLAIVPGNHEPYLGYEFGEASMRRYFGTEKEGTGNRVLEFGPLYVLLLDLYWPDLFGKEGVEWAEKALARAPEKSFRLVLMHEPIYSFGHHPPRPELTPLREVFRKAKVHAVFAGHSHIYEHFLVYGTHYLTLGGFGAPFHEPLENPVPSQKQFLVSTKQLHHFVLLEVSEESLKFSVVNASTGKEIEGWSVEK